MNINLTIIGQMITFLVFIFFTMKYIWPPLVNALKIRRKKIANGIKAASLAETKLKKAQDESCLIIQKAKNQANNILNNANIDANKIINLSKKKGHNIIKEMKLLATNQIQQEKLKVKRELHKEFVSVIFDILQKLLCNNTNFSKKIFIQDIIKEIKDI